MQFLWKHRARVITTCLFISGLTQFVNAAWGLFVSVPLLQWLPKNVPTVKLPIANMPAFSYSYVAWGITIILLFLIWLQGRKAQQPPPKPTVALPSPKPVAAQPTTPLLSSVVMAPLSVLSTDHFPVSMAGNRVKRCENCNELFQVFAHEAANPNFVFCTYCSHEQLFNPEKPYG